MKPNEEATIELQKQEKYIRFNKWCKVNGVKAPSLEYPVAFGKEGKLVGVRAKKEVGMYESYLYVPIAMTINEEQFKKSEVGHLFPQFEDQFAEKSNFEHILLIFFVTHELIKGEKSFWYPYFEIAEDADLPMLWPKKDLSLIEDMALRAAITEQKEDLEEEYEETVDFLREFCPEYDISSFTSQ